VKINASHNFLIVLLLPALLLAACSNNSGDELQGEPGQFSAAMVDGARNDVSPNGESRTDLTEEITESRSTAITRAVEKASASVVSITVTEVVESAGTPQDEFFRYFFGHNMPREYTNMGSGFLISEDGLVITNQHVVGANPNQIMVALTDGSTYNAEMIGSDELTDLALLRIRSDDAFPFVNFSDSDDVIVGEWAIALGNPFGLFEDGKPTVTVGVVSAKNRDFRPDPNYPRVYIDMIQTDAAINRGNSGGPLLNSEGDVIGINTFIYTGGTSAGFVGLGFAIPSNRIEKIISQLLTSGVVRLDYDPGMEFTAMTEQLVYRHNLPYVQGLLVTGVNKGGPAFECGLLPGDIILRIGDERVVSEMHAWAMLREYDEGDIMRLELLRNNNRYETEMHLRKKVIDTQ
jgi:serine protease Do